VLATYAVSRQTTRAVADTYRHVYRTSRGGDPALRGLPGWLDKQQTTAAVYTGSIGEVERPLPDSRARGVEARAAHG
jgi:hypothetical protein